LLDVRLGLVNLFDRHSLVISVGDYLFESDLAENWVSLGLVNLFDRHSIVVSVGDYLVESDLAENWVISQANFFFNGRKFTSSWQNFDFFRNSPGSLGYLPSFLRPI
jgi:hypothetical protein